MKGGTGIEDGGAGDGVNGGGRGGGGVESPPLFVISCGSVAMGSVNISPSLGKALVL